MNDLISIIVPVYNTEQYLPQCIESILSQTHTNIEIILVDDGSSDNSGKICDRYAEKDSRIVVIHKENGGLASARNAALDIAKGKYIGFVDSDDYIDKNMYKTLYDNMIQYNADITICDLYKIYENNITSDTKENISQIFDGQSAIEHMFLGRPFKFYLCNKLIKKGVIEDIRIIIGTEPREDVLFLYHMADNIKKVHFTSAPLYYYRIISDSLSHKTPSFGQNGSIYPAQKTCEIMLDDAEKKHYSFIPYVKYAIMLETCFTVIWHMIAAKSKNEFDIEHYKLCRQKFKEVFNMKSLRLANGLIKKIGFILFYVNINLFIAVFNSKPVKTMLADRLSP